MRLNNLTEGSIIKSLIALTIPIVLSNILQTAYQLTDTFWVGRLGAEAVAAVSLSFPIIFLMISLGGGLSIAGTILVAQYAGKKDLKSANHIATQTLILMVFSATVVAIIGYLISKPIITLMGAEPAVLASATNYLQITFLGSIFLFGYFVFESLMRGIGNVKTPLYIVSGTVLLNLILDPLFILGYGPIPAFGVGGAALATIGTQGLAALTGLIMLFSGKYGLHIKKEDIKLDKPLIKKMFKLGFPASMGQATVALGLTIMAFLVASFGTVITASYGIGMRIFSFIIIPAVGLSIATSTLVGQNIGAKKIKRAEKITLLSTAISFTTLSLFGLIFFLTATQLSAFFIPDNPEVIRISAQFIKIMALSFGFMGITQVTMGALRGAGETKTSMLIAMFSFFILQFPIAYILSKHTILSYVGIWWAYPLTNIITASVALTWFLKGSWKNKDLTEKI